MKAVFTKAVQSTAVRMQDAQRQEVRAALKAGAQPVSLCRYHVDGALVLRVERPASWRGEIHDRFRHLPLSCIIPADREAATRAWFERQTCSTH